MWHEITQDHVVEEIAQVIIPDTKSPDAFWINAARQLFCETLRCFLKAKTHEYGKFYKTLLITKLDILYNMLENTSAGAIMDPKIDRTAISVRASLSNHLNIFKDLKDDPNGISFMNFLKEDTASWLFFACKTNQRAYLKPIFSVWLSLCMKGIMNRNENNNKKTWIIIDELASLNRLPSLMTGLSEIRKYGGCFVLGFQDLSQVEDLYGGHQTKTLSNLTGTKVIFRTVDMDIANRLSKFLGEYEKVDMVESLSFGAHQMRDGVSLSPQKKTQAVVSAHQIKELENLEAYLMFPGQFSTTKVTFDYLNIKSKTEIFAANINDNQNTLQLRFNLAEISAEEEGDKEESDFQKTPSDHQKDQAMPDLQNTDENNVENQEIEKSQPHL